MKFTSLLNHSAVVVVKSGIRMNVMQVIRNDIVQESMFTIATVILTNFKVECIGIGRGLGNGFIYNDYR